MKTTFKFLLLCLVMGLVSCEKEELFEPVQKTAEISDGPKFVKARANLPNNLSLKIWKKSSDSSFGSFSENGAVSYNGKLWIADSDILDGGRIGTKIYTSNTGASWSLFVTDPFPIFVQDLLVHEGRIWAFGGQGAGSQIEVYSSGDGRNWSLETSSATFSYDDGYQTVVSYNGKIYAFVANFAEIGQRVYSLTDGLDWALENSSAFPKRYGTPIVFNDILYYVGGSTDTTSALDEIYQTVNGRDWTLVPGATINVISQSEDFPKIPSLAATVYENRVWITGTKTSIIGSDYETELWYSTDMRNWRLYQGKTHFPPLRGARMVNHNNEIALLGGSYYERGSWTTSEIVWGIKKKSNVLLPKPLPLPKPTIPGLRTPIRR